MVAVAWSGEAIKKSMNWASVTSVWLMRATMDTLRDFGKPTPHHCVTPMEAEKSHR